jgi:hypothetical protein
MSGAGVRGGNLYIGEDNIVFWGDRHVPNSGLYDNNLEQFVNNATVTFTLKDSSNVAVSGATGVSMSYVTGTKGVYEGVLEDGVSLTEGATYYLEITATASGDRVGFRRIVYIACYHGAT